MESKKLRVHSDYADKIKELCTSVDAGVVIRVEPILEYNVAWLEITYRDVIDLMTVEAWLIADHVPYTTV